MKTYLLRLICSLYVLVILLLGQGAAETGRYAKRDKVVVEDGDERGPAEADYDHLGRRLRTLEECALHKRTIRLTCPECGNLRILDAVALWWMFLRRGWDMTLRAVSRRLCCSVCWAAGHMRRPRLLVDRDAPTGKALPYPDAATWKRLVSRYRS